jgi:hypothetical protein
MELLKNALREIEEATDDPKIREIISRTNEQMNN